jgi:WD40-like Beta Propeller Repeat
MITRLRMPRVLLLATACLAGGPLQPQAAELPRLFPDYIGVTLPPNIAPLNFKIQEPGASYRVELRSSKGPPIAISSQNPAIRIPPKAWANLLHANPGEPFYWDISAQAATSGWTRFATVTNQIAREEIDGWLAYRLLKPIFNFYKHLGIYQRNLESFDQRVILEKDKFDQGCLNCHTPLNRNPNTFAFNIRAYGGKSPMILVVSNQAARVEKTMGYLAWHPSGRLLAFSANKLTQYFHTRGETRDVYDANSDLGIYHIDSNTVSYPPAIAAPGRNETWPAWSPDGRYLYFSSAAPQPLQKNRSIRYDLMRASFDIQTGQWGQPELMISAAETEQSVCEPKISPDGRFLLVTLCEYGNFPIHQSNSDLYVMDLANRKLRRLDINSDQADTWHSWSSNSRWVVFSSKRIDGLLARPHFSYVDAQGEFHKPFVLPQEDPTFYGFCLNTFNVPELMQGPVTIAERELARAIVQPRKLLTPQGPAGPSSPGSPSGQDQSNYQPTRE